MHTLIRAALVPLLVCGVASLASAQEFCVTCAGPDAKYRCLVGGKASPAAAGSRGQLLCITELARIGHHASCSVGRKTLDVCEGELRTVMFPGADEATAAPHNGWQPEPDNAWQPETSYPDGTTVAEQNSPQEPQAPTEAPPQTIGSLTKKAVDASSAGLKKAGEAVTDTAKTAGNAVAKTWTCVSSLFSDC